MNEIGSRGSFTAHQGYWICHHICTWSSVKLVIFKIVLCNWGGAPSHSLISYWNSLFSSHWLWGSFISIYFQYAILLGLRWTQFSYHILTFFSSPHHCTISHSLSTWSADSYISGQLLHLYTPTVNTTFSEHLWLCVFWSLCDFRSLSPAPR